MRHGYIPAHLLGNMWAQQWDNIEPIVKPFDDTPILDVTEAMQKQVCTILILVHKYVELWVFTNVICFFTTKNYTVEKMFRLAEEFFVNLGFEKMTETFWNESMLRKPEGKEVVCHSSAEEFYKMGDFR